MSSPLSLVVPPTASDEVRESVVKLLKETLADAEAGKIDTVIMILGHPDTEWSDRVSGTNRFSEAVGRLEITKQEWIAQYFRDKQK